MEDNVTQTNSGVQHRHEHQLSKMNRSESEWAFQRFLQEASAATFDDTTPSNSSADKTDVVHINDNGYSNNNATSKSCDNNYKGNAMSLSNGGCATAASSSFGAPADIPVESEDYHAILKSKLNMACAAVALSRVNLFPFHFLPISFQCFCCFLLKHVFIYACVCFLCDFSCGVFSFADSKLRKRKGLDFVLFLFFLLCLIGMKKWGEKGKFGFFLCLCACLFLSSYCVFWASG